MNRTGFKIGWCRLSFGLFVVLSLVSTGTVGEVNLASSLGDTRVGIVTTPEEQSMGRQFIASARQQMRFIDDPLLLEYIQGLGKRLTTDLEGDV